MKTFKKMTTVIFASVLLFTLVACGGSKSVVGTWTSVEDDIAYTFVFEKDGTGSLDLSGVSVPFEYKVEDDTITLTMTLLGTTEEDEYTYELSDKTLKLTDDANVTIELTKQ
ncbi:MULTISPECIES: DUF5640 domain-containing protein [Lachnospira]|jgi:uncharacterized lipoprotein YehR (DUF1307 family)|uniref:DUF5640 domain-containing protein n=1 Tax=Lachnospira multipara TaxID=28051 RepID=A0A1H5VHJ2_9FIRM|nr:MULTISPECIES: DUF5640 domain-containing protein [Lachnospira]SEF86789.1 hypothetical protein SAMN05216537_11150 [Lachnospira multipara]